jgi:hypothetical protein
MWNLNPHSGFPPSLGSKLMKLTKSGERIATLTRKLALAEIWSLSSSSSAFRFANRASVSDRPGHLKNPMIHRRLVDRGDASPDWLRRRQNWNSCVPPTSSRAS